MNPSTKEEFVELSQLIVGKLSNYEVMIMLCEVRPCLITLRRELKTHYFWVLICYWQLFHSWSGIFEKCNRLLKCSYLWLLLAVFMHSSSAVFFSFFQSSAEYVPFLEMLFRDLCAGCKWLVKVAWFLRNK